MQKVSSEKKASIGLVAAGLAAIAGIISANIALKHFDRPAILLITIAITAGVFAIIYIAIFARVAKMRIRAVAKDFYRYNIITNSLQIYFFGVAKKRPLFNLWVKRVYSGGPPIEHLRGEIPWFESQLKCLWHAITAAKKIIGEEVHVDADGRLWPGYISGLPIRMAEVDVVMQMGNLAYLYKAFADESVLRDPAFLMRMPAILIAGSESLSLPSKTYRICFDGRRPYLYELSPEAAQAKPVASSSSGQKPDVVPEAMMNNTV